MTVQSLTKLESVKALALPEPEREISGCYIGDLLSWVMGRAKADDAWITIMSNANIVAVASLADVACILLSEGVEVPQAVLDTALAKGVNVLQSALPTYETAVLLSQNF